MEPPSVTYKKSPSIRQLNQQVMKMEKWVDQEISISLHLGTTVAVLEALLAVLRELEVVGNVHCAKGLVHALEKNYISDLKPYWADCRYEACGSPPTFFSLFWTCPPRSFS
eukprot:TRINITY_DN12902_c0_g2_i1.p1 TRINITY_DN12902_c0_g2~~TRINITY_DN12902_c0_g2_i1.p1  ORF type:complete len:111 (-),score=21.59 TRINITY_DN12902_c0_g2_i1:424-756(-)